MVLGICNVCVVVVALQRKDGNFMENSLGFFLAVRQVLIRNAGRWLAWGRLMQAARAEGEARQGSRGRHLRWG